MFKLNQIMRSQKNEEFLQIRIIDTNNNDIDSLCCKCGGCR